jgi:hypothetical protein
MFLIPMETPFEMKASGQIRFSCLVLLGFRATTFRDSAVSTWNSNGKPDPKSWQRRNDLRPSPRRILDEIPVQKQVMRYPACVNTIYYYECEKDRVSR